MNVSTEGEICISFIFRMSINPEYGHVNGERANHGNGSAPPPRGDARAAAIELAIPKLRTGNYFLLGC